MNPLLARPFRKIGIAAVLASALFSLPACRDQDSSLPPLPPEQQALRSPVRISSRNQAAMIVSDHGADRVCIVDRATLLPSSCFAVDGKPLGVASSAGTIFVGNQTRQVVQTYGADGAKRADLPGTFQVPTSLAVDTTTGLLFVLDAGTRTISLLTTAGYPVRTVTGDASGDGQLVNPVALAIDPVRQEILVSDYGDMSSGSTARIRIYAYDGTFLAAVNGGAAGFSRPQGLCVSGGHVFLADGILGQVLVFDRASLTWKKTLGSFGNGPGQLMLPLDVMVDASTNNVYVTNNRSSRIELFAKGGLVP